MKKVIAFICFAIFSFQVIPVKALGRLLASNQMTEEVQHDICSKKGACKEDLHKSLYFHCLLPNGGDSNKSSNTHKYLTATERLIKNLSLEVPLRPPLV